MSNLAVKLFMVDNQMLDAEAAERVMYTYGLAEPYEDFARRLEFLLVDDDTAEQEAFAEGAEFVQDLIDGIRFASNGPVTAEVAKGIQIAMDGVKSVVASAVDGARMAEAVMPEFSNEDIFAAVLKAFSDIQR